MPSSIVKLSSADARAWTHNQPVWLDEHGEVARPVTREEQHAISKALERSTKIKQSFRSELPLLPLNASGRRTQAQRRNATVERLDAAFEISYVGEKRVVTVWNGRNRYATGREVLAARLLADHGECVLHGRNGKCIGVLRDPFINQREPVTGRRVQWSRNPLDPRKNEAERSELTEGAQNERVSPVKRKRRKVALDRSRKPLYSPAQCPNDCRGMRGGQAWKVPPSAQPPTTDEHHPFCQHASAWAATLDPAKTTEVLYDLETSTVKRSAMPEEIEEANLAEARTGIRQVTVAGRVYAVLPPDEARQAAAEARGASLADDGADGLEDADADAPPDDEESEVELDETPRGDAAVEAAAGRTSTPGDRESWPTLDELRPNGRALGSSTVTARDYLARPGQSENRAP